MDGLDPRISYRVRDLREKCGYSREYLANLSELSVKTLWNFENAKYDLRLVNFVKICTALHASSDSLLFDKNDLSAQASMLFSQMSPEKQRIVIRILSAFLQDMVIQSGHNE